jgi:hypothetical protein
MAGGFAITTSTTNAKLPANRQGQFQFTVTNTSGRQLTVRGKVVAQTPEQSAWFTIEGPTERLCAPNATLNYMVDAAIPATAPATPITFHLDAVGVENPDEYNSQGPAIVLEVPPASLPKKPFPWWIVAVAVAGILVLGGGGYLAYKMVSSSGNQAVAKTTPTPTPTAPPPANRFLGTWVGAPGSPNTKLVVGQGTGSNLTVSYSGTCLFGGLQAGCSSNQIGGVTGTYDASIDRVTFQWSPNVIFSNSTVFGFAVLDKSGQIMTVTVTWAYGTQNIKLSRTPCLPACAIIQPVPSVSAAK